ncbi:Symplekin [Smittium culicis]|uniref:Symplekin n=2 Tax=Smittium culicis TaxID=133412 RepID=A0A1R1YHG7_9FUNG|nr:Symplekin [Smittium culicis]
MDIESGSQNYPHDLAEKLYQKATNSHLPDSNTLDQLLDLFKKAPILLVDCYFGHGLQATAINIGLLASSDADSPRFPIVPKSNDQLWYLIIMGLWGLDVMDEAVSLPEDLFDPREHRKMIIDFIDVIWKIIDSTGTPITIVKRAIQSLSQLYTNVFIKASKDKSNRWREQWLKVLKISKKLHEYVQNICDSNSLLLNSLATFLSTEIVLFVHLPLPKASTPIISETVGINVVDPNHSYLSIVELEDFANSSLMLLSTLLNKSLSLSFENRLASYLGLISTILQLIETRPGITEKIFPNFFEWVSKLGILPNDSKSTSPYALSKFSAKCVNKSLGISLFALFRQPRMAQAKNFLEGALRKMKTREYDAWYIRQEKLREREIQKEKVRAQELLQLEASRIEKERIDNEKKEKERMEREKLENEKERLENERQEKLAQDRQIKERNLYLNKTEYPDNLQKDNFFNESKQSNFYSKINTKGGNENQPYAEHSKSNSYNQNHLQIHSPSQNNRTINENNFRKRSAPIQNDLSPNKKHSGVNFEHFLPQNSGRSLNDTINIVTKFSIQQVVELVMGGLDRLTNDQIHSSKINRSSFDSILPVFERINSFKNKIPKSRWNQAATNTESILHSQSHVSQSLETKNSQSTQVISGSKNFQNLQFDPTNTPNLFNAPQVINPPNISNISTMSNLHNFQSTSNIRSIPNMPNIPHFFNNPGYPSENVLPVKNIPQNESINFSNIGNPPLSNIHTAHSPFKIEPPAPASLNLIVPDVDADIDEEDLLKQIEQNANRVQFNSNLIDDAEGLHSESEEDSDYDELIQSELAANENSTESTSNLQTIKIKSELSESSQESPQSSSINPSADSELQKPAFGSISGFIDNTNNDNSGETTIVPNDQTSLSRKILKAWKDSLLRLLNFGEILCEESVGKFGSSSNTNNLSALLRLHIPDFEIQWPLSPLSKSVTNSINKVSNRERVSDWMVLVVRTIVISIGENSDNESDSINREKIDFIQNEFISMLTKTPKQSYEMYLLLLHELYHKLYLNKSRRIYENLSNDQASFSSIAECYSKWVYSFGSGILSCISNVKDADESITPLTKSQTDSLRLEIVAAYNKERLSNTLTNPLDSVNSTGYSANLISNSYIKSLDSLKKAEITSYETLLTSKNLHLVHSNFLAKFVSPKNNYVIFGKLKDTLLERYTLDVPVIDDSLIKLIQEGLGDPIRSIPSLSALYEIYNQRPKYSKKSLALILLATTNSNRTVRLNAILFVKKIYEKNKKIINSYALEKLEGLVSFGEKDLNTKSPNEYTDSFSTREDNVKPSIEGDNANKSSEIVHNTLNENSSASAIGEVEGISNTKKASPQNVNDESGDKSQDMMQDGIDEDELQSKEFEIAEKIVVERVELLIGIMGLNIELLDKYFEVYSRVCQNYQAVLRRLITPLIRQISNDTEPNIAEKVGSKSPDIKDEDSICDAASTNRSKEETDNSMDTDGENKKTDSKMEVDAITGSSVFDEFVNLVYEKMETCPIGSELLLLRILVLIMENSQANNFEIDCTKMLEFIRRRRLDARYLILILDKLPKEQVTLHLNKLVMLFVDMTSAIITKAEPAGSSLNDVNSSAHVTGNLVVDNRLVNPITDGKTLFVASIKKILSRNNQESKKESFGFTPSEILVSFHKLQPSDFSELLDGITISNNSILKGLAESIQVLFRIDGIDVSAVGTALKVLVNTRGKLPTLLMRSMITAYRMYPLMKDFLSNLLVSLITNNSSESENVLDGDVGRYYSEYIWDNKMVWNGFVILCNMLSPNSKTAVQMLPADKQAEIFAKYPNLAEKPEEAQETIQEENQEEARDNKNGENVPESVQDKMV